MIYNEASRVLTLYCLFCIKRLSVVHSVVGIMLVENKFSLPLCY